MSAPRVAMPLIAFSACALSCCSLFIDDYELVDCNPDASRCDELSEDLEGECFRYVCSESGYGCVLRESDGDDDGDLVEICDGRDNDCDDRIDEGVISGAAPDEIAIGEGVAGLTPAATPKGSLLIALTKPDATRSTMRVSSYILIDDEDEEEERGAFPVDKCLGSGATLQDCNIDELAIAADDDALIATGIHRSTCGGGQLRIGIGSVATSDVELGEFARAQRTALGIDIDSEQGCSLSAGCAGVSGPVLALLRGTDVAKREAVVAFLARTAAEPEDCSATQEHRVAVVAAVIERSGDSFQFASSTSERSVVLSASSATGPPALTAIEGSAAGFLAAYPSGDRIQLLFIPSTTRASSLGPKAVTASFEARDPRSVSIVAHEDGSRRFAAAYQTIEDGKAAIRLATFSLGIEQSPRIAIGASATVHVKGVLVAGPMLSYRSSGVSVAAPGRPAGGWFVVWVEQATSGEDPHVLMLWRVAENGVNPLNDDPAVVKGDMTLPFTYRKHQAMDQDTLNAGFIEGDLLHLKELTCVRSP